jgi:hypothetical protein
MISEQPFARRQAVEAVGIDLRDGKWARLLDQVAAFLLRIGRSGSGNTFLLRGNV